MNIRKKFSIFLQIYLAIFFIFIFLLGNIQGPLYSTNLYHSFVLISVVVLAIGSIILFFVSLIIIKKYPLEKRSRSIYTFKREKFDRYSEDSYKQYDESRKKFRKSKIVLFVSILFLFVYYIFIPVIHPIYISYTLEQEEKETRAIEYYVEKSDFVEEGFDIGSARFISEKLIKTDESVYELSSFISHENSVSDFKRYLKKANFDVDVSSFKIAEPIANENNSFSRSYKSYKYHSFYIPGVYRIGDYSFLDIEVYDYKYFKDINHIYYIDQENLNQKEYRIRKENNLTTISDIQDYVKKKGSAIGFSGPSILSLSILENATPQNWKLLDEYYSKSDKYVYYLGNIMYFYKNHTKHFADPHTFEITGKRKAKDKSGIWIEDDFAE